MEDDESENIVEKMSVHIILDIFDVEEEKLKKVDSVKFILDRVVTEAGFNVIDSKFHQFNPHGVTAIYLLAESHVSIHTWPEARYAAIDIFTCGDERQAFKACELIEKLFEPKRVIKQVIWRNYYRQREG